MKVLGFSTLQITRSVTIANHSKRY